SSYCRHFLLCVLLLFLPSDSPSSSDIYPLSLHDALPICLGVDRPGDPVDAFVVVELAVHWNSSSFFCSAPRARDRCVLTDPSLQDRKSTRLNSSHVKISYAVFCLEKKNSS